MQYLLKLLSQRKKTTPAPTKDQLINLVREYLQLLILKSVYGSKHGRSLSFMGGTCLRLCYDLKRYSEDLDFSLDRKLSTYSFADLGDIVRRDLEMVGFSVQVNVSEDKLVQKATFKIIDLLDSLQLAIRKGQRLHIKLEVDTSPPKVLPAERESFFINRHGLVFPIVKHDLPVLFAGKVLAILCRTYGLGRDYYDLIWYLGRKTPINMDYFRRGLKRSEKFEEVRAFPSIRSQKDVFKVLEKKVIEVTGTMILKDIGRFLEDPTEEAWIRNYQDVFRQLSQPYF